MSRKRIIYAGTPAFAVPALLALLQCPSEAYEVVAVYTQPDRGAGRGKKLHMSPVKQCALEHGIPVYQPEHFSHVEYRHSLAALRPDLMVVTAYGLLLPEAVLSIPTLGCINIHASLLPRWRGAAPIQRAIASGDQETGITLMQMNKGLDTGPVLATQALAIRATDTSESLHMALAELGAQLLMQNLSRVLEGEIVPLEQDHNLATYANKLSKAEAHVDWKQKAVVLQRQIRAMVPWPVAYTHWQERVLRIWHAEVIETKGCHDPGVVIACHREGLDVATIDGVLRIKELQLSGGKRLSIQDFANAHHLAGQQLK